MASLRDGIAQSIVAVIDALEGWEAYRRDTVRSMTFTGRLAVVNILGEDKRVPGGEVTYDNTLRIGVLIVANREDADPVLDGSLEMRYLDRSVADIERVVHTATSPADAQLTIVRHEVKSPGEENVLQALVELRAQYSHNFNDPDVFDPVYG